MPSNHIFKGLNKHHIHLYAISLRITPQMEFAGNLFLCLRSYNPLIHHGWLMTVIPTPISFKNIKNFCAPMVINITACPLFLDNTGLWKRRVHYQSSLTFLSEEIDVPSDIARSIFIFEKGKIIKGYIRGWFSFNEYASIMGKQAPHGRKKNFWLSLLSCGR